MRTTARSCFVGLLGVVTFALTAVTARADSDGYYCVGDHYLAFQIRGGLSGMAVSGHAVRVVRFGPDIGLEMAGELVLPDFQPHKMVCQKNEVTIAGWVDGPVEFVIDVTGAPTLLRKVSNPDMALRRSTMTNLGAWAPVGTVALKSNDPKHAYRLVMTERSEKTPGGFIHRKQTVMEMVDAEGAVVQSLPLFDGEREETVD